MKKLFYSLLVLTLVLAGCSTTNETEQTAQFTAGEYSGSAQGYAGEVQVTITVNESSIEDVVITGEKETPEYGGEAMTSLATTIVENNGVEVEVVSGATATSNAVLSALEQAMSAAKGEEQVATAAQDGEYVTQVMGYKNWIYVTTTFKDGAIANVVVTSHDETMGIGNYATSRVPGKIVEAQSLNVDGVSGATVSSNAVKQAVRDAITEAGGSLSTYEVDVPQPEIVEEQIELTTEVVVVGAGTAGLVAGTRLAEMGHEVVMFEKMDIPGGAMATTYSGIMNSYSEVTSNFALGAEQESASWNMEILLPYFEYLITPEYDRYNKEQPYQQVMLVNAGKVVDWFHEIGVGFSSMGYYEGGTQYGLTPYLAPGCYNGGAGYAAMFLADRLTKLETPIHYATEVTELITDDSGAVIGVKASSEDGKQYTVYADAVLLATGGFAENPEMVAEYYPQYAGLDFNANPGSTGDGILMAQAIGADIETMGRELGAFMSEYGSTYSLSFMHSSTPGILVDTTGYEFANIMSSNHHVLSHALVNEEHGGEFYYIYDEQAMQSTKDFDAYGFSYEGLFDRPATQHYATVEEAAEALDLPGLAEAIEKNNEVALSGEKNEFGRGNLPYIETRDGIWITRVMPTLYLTTGGLVTDTQTHVFNTDGEIIPGLYAAGDVAGSIEEKDGKRYGNGFDQALGYGWEAADVISQEIQ